MRKAQKGDAVAIRFTAKTDKGMEIASTPEGEHLDVVVGDGRLLPAIEAQLFEMGEGDVRTFEISKEEGFPRDEQMIIEVPRDQFDPNMEIEVGGMVGLQDPNGHQLAAEIVAVTEETVRLDANPPFTGCALTMTLELARIKLD